MSIEERPAKRQRSSLSPASPPYHLSKSDSQARRTSLPPHTPPSPSRMYSGHASPKPFAQTFPTPPHTAGLSSQSVTAPMTAPETSQSTAITSQDTPISLSMSRDGDRDTQMTEVEDTQMIDAADHRRTDHERHSRLGDSGIQGLLGPLPLLCQTRKIFP